MRLYLALTLILMIFHVQPGLGTSDLEGDALKAKYLAIGKDPAQALFTFDRPGWNLTDSLPEELKVNDLIHQWYLIGRNIPDEQAYRKFCYLFAAGRAGHYYAAFEAGEMLLKFNTDVIPLKITLDDLVAQIPAMKKSEAIRDWDVCMLNQSLIDDPDLRDYFNPENSSTWQGIRDFFEDLAQLKKNQKEEAFQKLNNILDELILYVRQHIDTKLSTFKAKNASITSVEYLLLSTYAPLMVEGAIYSLYETCIINISNSEHAKLAASPYLLKRINKLKQKFPKDEFKRKAETFIREHQQYAELPVYRYILEDLYDSLADMYKTPEYKVKKTSLFLDLLKERLNSEILGNIGDKLYDYQLLTLRRALSMDELITCYQQVMNSYIMSCLLGETDYMDEMVDINSELVLKMFNVAKSTQHKNLEKMMYAFNPMVAFCLQLNLLRHPENGYVYSAVWQFYAHDIGAYDRRTGEGGIMINRSRYLQAATVVEEGAEQRKKAKKASAKKEPKLDRGTIIHQNLKNCYLEQLSAVFHKAFSLYQSKKHLFSMDVDAVLYAQMLEIEDGVARLKRDSLNDKRVFAADFKSHCNRVEAQIRQLDKEIKKISAAAKPVLVVSGGRDYGEIETLQDIRDQTREVKELARLQLMTMPAQRDVIIENNNNEVNEVVVEKAYPFKTARFEILCSLELVEETLKAKAVEILKIVQSSQDKGSLFSALSDLTKGYNFEVLKVNKGGSIRIETTVYSHIEQAWSLRLNDRVRFCILWIQDQAMPELVVGEYEH